jgi:hypothetical protein
MATSLIAEELEWPDVVFMVLAGCVVVPHPDRRVRVDVTPYHCVLVSGQGLYFGYKLLMGSLRKAHRHLLWI